MFSTILASAVTATLVSALFKYWQDREVFRSTTKLEAHHLAVALEGYALNSLEDVSNQDTYEQSNGQTGKAMDAIKKLPELPVSRGFVGPRKSRLTDRLLVLPQSVSEANQEAQFYFDVVGEIEDVQSILKSGAAKIGILATILARDIRLEYELPYRRLKFRDYDVEEKLREFVCAHKP